MEEPKQQSEPIKFVMTIEKVGNEFQASLNMYGSPKASDAAIILGTASNAVHRCARTIGDQLIQADETKAKLFVEVMNCAMEGKPLREDSRIKLDGTQE